MNMKRSDEWVYVDAAKPMKARYVEPILGLRPLGVMLEWTDINARISFDPYFGMGLRGPDISRSNIDPPIRRTGEMRTSYQTITAAWCFV